MKTILFADDSQANRELLHELLEATGYAVIEAADGQEAIDRVRAQSPDLVLLDLQMPKRDGFQVLAELRRDPQLVALPVIALTAYAMRGDRERVLEAGFDGYLTKPLDIAALKAEISRHLG